MTLPESFHGTLRLAEGRFVFEVPELDILLSVVDLSDVRAQLEREFADLVEEYVNVEDASLDGPAQQLKRRIVALLGAR